MVRACVQVRAVVRVVLLDFANPKVPGSRIRDIFPYLGHARAHDKGSGLYAHLTAQTTVSKERSRVKLTYDVVPKITRRLETRGRGPTSYVKCKAKGRLDKTRALALDLHDPTRG